MLYGVLVLAFAAVAGLGLNYVFNPSSPAASAVRTATVERGVVQTTETSTGNIAGASTASLDFSTSGTVTAVDVAVGDHVHAGEVLAKIDPSQAEAALSSARASLAAAQQNLATAQQGGSSSTKTSNKATLVNDQSSLAAAEQQLGSDETALATAQSQLAADESLGCPTSGSSSAGSTGASSGSSASSSSSSSASSSGSSTGTGSSGSTGSSGTSGSSGSPSSSSTGTTAAAESSAVALASTAAPSASTGAASGVSARTATLSGSVDPNGASTSYSFLYGRSSSLDESTPAEIVGSGTSATTVTFTLTNLRPDTTYGFRIVATNAYGTVEGAVVNLTTEKTSCATDRETVTSDAQTVQHQTAAVNQAKLALAAQQASIAETAQTNATTIEQDRATVDTDQATVSSDETALAGTTITSPITGTVTAVNGSAGETVSAGTSTVSSAAALATSSSSSSASGGSGSSSGFITVTNLGSLDVVVSFPEADIGQVAVGQPATVTLAALTSTELPGKVTWVSPTSTVSSNVVDYDVTIALGDPPSTVRDGMTADVSVVTATESGVLYVPSSAITTVGTRSTVTVLQGKKQVTRQVVTGLVGSSTTQVVSGLKAGEQVVLPTVSVSSTASSGTSGAFVGRGFGRGGGGFLRRLGG